MRISPALTCCAAAVAVVAAGCSGGSREAPPAPPQSSPPQVAPTEKGALSRPPQAFNQNMNAADGKSALESEGYSVQINWGNGRRDKPLSQCTITDVDGLSDGVPAAGTTVYLTVTCP